MKNYETLSEAIADLKERGYDHDFNLHAEWIESPQHSKTFGPDDFHVDEVHRFEGMTNPSDSSVLYAIQCNNGLMGLLVDAYGMYADNLNEAMIMRLRIDSNTRH